MLLHETKLHLKRHCGRDPQSPERKDLSSRSGDGGSLSAMTVKGLRFVSPFSSLILSDLFS